MKVSPKLLKFIGLFFIIAGTLLWPISLYTFAKDEAPVTLGISWLAIILTGLAFYTAAQDGEDLDKLIKLVKRMDDGKRD